MKIDRIIGGILSTFVIVIIVGYYKDNNRSYNNPYELNADNAVIADNSISYEANKFDENIKYNEEIIEYVNKERYIVTIDSESVRTSCTGKTSEDEVIANASYKVKVSFSNTKKGVRNESMTLKPGEKGFIRVSTSYEGNLPSSEVTCNYSVSITSA